MKRPWTIWLLGGLSLVAILVALSVLTEGRDTYHYRMAVEVETPKGLRTGSAVREIKYGSNIIKLPDMAAATAKQRGEAVAVDLPGGQALFALLPIDAYETMQAAFGNDSAETLDAAKADKHVVELKPKPNSIPEQSGYPLLVRFRDQHDPRSVERVEPDNLAASFGPGTRLKRITVQMTDEPVTVGIGKLLPPISPGFIDWYKSLKYGDPRRLDRSRFQKGTAE